MKRKLLGILLLGFASGLPYMLVFSTLTAWLRDVSISLTEIGFFAWLVLTYSLKFLWAPFVDRYSIPGFVVFGKRRGWILFSQLIIFLSLIGMSFIDPLKNIQLLALFAFCITLENGSHFFSSLKLYFSTFEFNSALVLPISEVLYFFAQFLGDEWALSMFGEKAMYWNPVPWVSPFFGLIVLLLCIKFFLHQKKGDWSSFFETSVMLFVTYYLMSSTVHPWYLVIPLGLSVFSSNKIPLLWSVSIFASYALYTNPNFAARVGIWSVQYIPILLILLHQVNWLKDKT